MWVFPRRYAVAATALILAGCATADAPSARVAPMNLARGAARVAPPLGLINLCDRRAGFCGDAPRPAAARGGDGAALFHALLAPGAQPGLGGAMLTPERARLLSVVNAQVNGAIGFATDAAIFGVDERWSFPISAPERNGAPRGDCEDYALEKREALLAAGWPAEDLSLVTAYVPRLGLHLILVAHTSQGDIALDMLRDAPTPVGALHYRWIAAQRGADVLDWRPVALAPLSMGVRA